MQAVRQPHRLDTPGQQSSVDMRPSGHGGRTSDDEDNKRIRSSDEGGHRPVRSTSGDPTGSPQPAEQPPQQDRDLEELLDASVEQGGGSARPYQPGLPSPAPERQRLKKQNIALTLVQNVQGQ